MDQMNQMNPHKRGLDEHHGFTTRGEYRHSGFPQENQASIYAFNPRKESDFNESIKGYNDGRKHFEYTQGYGTNTLITTRCDDFHDTYNGKTIDYYIARADDGGKGNIKCHKVRVVGKYIRPNGKWALKLSPVH